jgi:drug/metabolite transporter (DMT)-like permease
MMRDEMRAQREAMRAQRRRLRYQMRAMRRRSILGPLLMIALGVLFLLVQSGRIDDQRFWERFGHWWPLLLLLAGVILLAEWAYDQFRLRNPDQPRYRRSVGAGAVLLLIVLIVTGILASTGFHFRRR